MLMEAEGGGGGGGGSRKGEEGTLVGWKPSFIGSVGLLDE